MKHKFMLIPYQGKVKAGAKIFCVMVGESGADQMRKAWIETHAALSGWFFNRWDGEAEDYLELISVDKPVTPFFNWSQYDIIYVNVGVICQAIADDSLFNIQQPNSVLSIRRQMLSVLAPYILNPCLKALAKAVPFSRIRKNLSKISGGDLGISLIYFGLILLLFLFSGWLEGRYVYGY